jgi:hypothetical protein
MAHDHNGRVGPPRCEECNAPLNSDDRRPAPRDRSASIATSNAIHFLVKRRSVRHASVFEFTPFSTAIRNPRLSLW